MNCVYINDIIVNYILCLKWGLQIYVCMSMLPTNIIHSHLNEWMALKDFDFCCKQDCYATVLKSIFFQELKYFVLWNFLSGTY